MEQNNEGIHVEKHDLSAPEPHLKVFIFMLGLIDACIQQARSVPIQISSKLDHQHVMNMD